MTKHIHLQRDRGRQTRVSQQLVAPIANRLAFTLVELLVVVAILSLLAGLLIPAVGSARAAARKTQCKNQARQIGLSLLLYAEAKQSLPPSAVTHSHSWIPYVLPFLDDSAIASSYDQSKPWTDAANQPMVQSQLPVFVCASAPTRAASLPGLSDYAVPSRVEQILKVGEMRWLVTPRCDGAMITNKETRLRRIRDGMSKTMLVVEVAGRPQFWTSTGRGPSMNRPGCPNQNVRDGTVLGAAWADPENYSPLHGFDPDGLTCPGPVAINATNNNEAFSFHPGGATVAYGDGAVDFLGEAIDLGVYAGMITREGEVTGTHFVNKLP